MAVEGGKLSISSQEEGISAKSVSISSGEISVMVPAGENPFGLSENDGLNFTGGALTLPSAAENDSIIVGSKEYYLVILDAKNGAEPKRVLVEKDQELAAETPEKTGCTFEGWYTAASGGEKWDQEKPVNTYMTLYAQWTAKHEYSWSGVWSKQGHILPLA